MAGKKRVFVGLSGGVDSAVSGALLQQEGYEVTGLFAWIALEEYPCSAGEDRREALQVAVHMRMPFEEIDLSEEYRKRVFVHSLEAYRRGETPNPDALCNREIKFGLLYDYAKQCGADFFATGHYARTQKVGAETHLLAGEDSEKDQSYFLWAVPQTRLARVLFPLGAMHKNETRSLAKKFALPNAERKDSQGLCFLGNVSMEDTLICELQTRPGMVLDEKGAAIGTHRGAILYTTGQRHGFQLRGQGRGAKPHYVIGKDIKNNTITVSAERIPVSEKNYKTLLLREENWIGTVESGPCEARFRYRQELIAAVLHLERKNGKTSVALSKSQLVPLGQSLVLYRGKRCLGGGVIDALYPVR